MNEKIKEIRFNPEKAQCFFSKKLAFTLGPIELKNLIDEGKVKLLDVRKKKITILLIFRLQFLYLKTNSPIT